MRRLCHGRHLPGQPHRDWLSPKRDKFASQIGDPTGLLGRAEPVFVGGQCGLVAPVRLPFGAVVPAGTIMRRWSDVDDALPSDSFLRKCFLGGSFVADLEATHAWYTQVRLAAAQDLDERLVRGALRRLTAHIAWRKAELLRYLQRKLSGSDHTAAHTEAPPARIARTTSSTSTCAARGPTRRRSAICQTS